MVLLNDYEEAGTLNKLGLPGTVHRQHLGCASRRNMYQQPARPIRGVAAHVILGSKKDSRICYPLREHGRSARWHWRHILKDAHASWVVLVHQRSQCLAYIIAGVKTVKIVVACNKLA